VEERFSIGSGAAKRRCLGDSLSRRHQGCM